MIPVLVTVPNTGWIHKHCSFALLRLQLDQRYQVTIQEPTHSPYVNNLHHCVNEFVGGDYRWWLTFDSDNPPMRNPLDLIKFDRDVMGCPTPVWHFTGKEKPGERPIYWNAYDFVPEAGAYKEHQPREGLQRVDAVGTGCVLFSRRVFSKPEMRLGPFLRVFNPDGTVDRGNDIAFSERARRAGFEIWAHYGYPARHFVELELTEVVRGFRNLYEPDYRK